MPNIREMFAADARGECLYTSIDEAENSRYTLEAAADYTLQQLQQQQQQQQQIPESVRAGLRKAFFYYGDAAGCGQVKFYKP